MARVLVVEDEPALRSMLAAFLTERGHQVKVAGEAATANQIAAVFKPQAALLDVHLGPGPSGIDLAVALTRLHPGIAIVFLTNVVEPRLMGNGQEMLPQGYAYVLKSRISSATDVATVVQAALDRRVGANMRDDLRAPSGVAELSTAQIDVLRMVAAGASNKRIAAERGTTERAVESLIQRAATTLGVSHSADTNIRVQVANAYLRSLGLQVRGEHD